MKILVIFGTRPGAIKMAPVIHNLKEAGIPTYLCITAQHRSMLDQVMEAFELKADFDLNLMQPNQSLNQLSANILTHLDKVLLEVNPSLVLVHGDTTTSSMAAFAAFHRGVKVGHVEAGLRTYRKDAPFPEEINRQITGRIADLHFAPTQRAMDNLINEGTHKEEIIISGNTVIDALKWMIKKIDKGYQTSDMIRVKSLLSENKTNILVTGHRRENFGEGFMQLCEAIRQLADENPEVRFIYPVHLNPNVREPVFKILGNHQQIILTEPVDYPAMIELMSQCKFILTDSGGIQEEAPTLNKPVVLMRETTERTEGIDAGCVILTGTDKTKILHACRALINDNELFMKMSKVDNPYGDGKAGDRITNFIVEKYGL